MATDNPLTGLLVRFRADSAEFSAAVKDIRGQVDDFAVKNESTLQKLEGMFVAFGAAVVAAGEGTAQVFQQTENVAGAASRAIVSVAEYAAAAVVAIKAYGVAVVQGTAVSEKMVDGYRALRIALDPSIFTGVTIALGLLVEEAIRGAKAFDDLSQKLAFTSARNGKDYGDLVGLNFAEQMQGLAAGTLSQFGYSSAKLDEIAQKFQNLTDPIERARLAVQYFGAKAEEALPLMTSRLRENLDAANALAAALDKNTAASLRRFAEDLKVPGQSLDNLKDSLRAARLEMDLFLATAAAATADTFRGLGQQKQKGEQGTAQGFGVATPVAESMPTDAEFTRMLTDSYKQLHAAQMEYVGSTGLAVIASGKFNKQIQDIIPAFKAASIEELVWMQIGARNQNAQRASIGILADLATAHEAFGKKLAYASSEVDDLDFRFQIMNNVIQDSITQIGKLEDIKIPDLLKDWLPPMTSIEDLMHSIGVASDAEMRKVADSAKEVYEALIALQDAGIASDTEVSKAYEHWSQLEDKVAGVTSATSVAGTKSISEFGKASNRVFNDLSNGIANVITSGGKMSDVFLKVAKDIEASIIKYLIQSAFKQLAKVLGELMQNMTGILGQIGGILVKIGGGAASGAAGAAGGAAGSAAGGGASAAGSIASGLSGALASWIGVGVSAAAGIVSGIQQAHANNLLDEIEKSTRYTKIYTGEQTQSILWSTQTTAERLTYVNDSLDLMKSDTHWYVVPILREILDNVRQGVKTVNVTAVGNDAQKQAADFVRQLKLKGVTV